MNISHIPLFIITIINILEVLTLIVPVLMSVAFITIAERKTMASMQRRLGPNLVGYYGLLQAFADALKLLIKEYVYPTQANIILFFIGPLITLLFSLYGYAMIPYGPGISVYDFNFGLLYMLIVSSLATYGILLAGWSANSKYAFLGSLRSTAQLISYELILSSALLLVVLLTGTLNLSVIVEMQKATWFILPLFPLFYIFFIASIAETNRAPFDLAEAESELVSGFMTEHAAGIFVFFFLGEYASIILICILITLILLGGYDIITMVCLLEKIISTLLFIFFTFIYTIYIYSTFIFFFILNNSGEIINKIFNTNIFLDNYSNYPILNSNTFNINMLNFSSNLDNIKETFQFNEYMSIFFNNTSNYIKFNLEHIIYESKERLSLSSYSNIIADIIRDLSENKIFVSLTYALGISIKTIILIFVFIWVRASFPRIRYDQLMSFCWTKLLPLIIGIIILIPCLIYFYDSILYNLWLL
jgi:NADH-ubiquinone oxidoreductase chain 1